jgi:isopenicillin-N N-acyltransferase-like protein
MTCRHATSALILGVAALAGAGCGRDAPADPERESGDGPTPAERSNGIYYLELEGTPTEMGRRHGTLLKRQIREQVADYRKEVIKTFGEQNGRRILDHVVKDSGFLRDVRKHLPHVYAEMEGIAEGAGVPVNDVLLINMYEEVYEGAPLALGVKPLQPQGKCTTLHCAGRRGLPNLNAQNLDYTPNLDGAQLVIHDTYPGGLKVLLYTFAGQVGGIGVNSRGLSMVCNTLPEGSKRDNEGLGSIYVTRGLLEQDSVAGAVKWLQKVPQFSAYNYSLVDATDAVMVEFSPKGLARLETPKDRRFLAHANHLLKLDDRNEVPGYPKGKPEGDVSGRTVARQKAADERMAGKGAAATVEDLKAVLIAAPVNNSGEWVTLQSVIIVHDRDDLRMYASAGNDTRRAWNVYKFER